MYPQSLPAQFVRHQSSAGDPLDLACTQCHSVSGHRALDAVAMRAWCVSRISTPELKVATLIPESEIARLVEQMRPSVSCPGECLHKRCKRVVHEALPVPLRAQKRVASRHAYPQHTEQTTDHQRGQASRHGKLSGSACNGGVPTPPMYIIPTCPGAHSCIASSRTRMASFSSALPIGMLGRIQSALVQAWAADQIVVSVGPYTLVTWHAHGGTASVGTGHWLQRRSGHCVHPG